MRKIIVVALIAMSLCLSFMLVACGAPLSAQGKYTNTREGMSDSYINVTSEDKCDLQRVWVAQLHEYVYGENKTFNVSSDGKTIYLEYTSSLSLTASFDLKDQKISYSGYDYRK